METDFRKFLISGEPPGEIIKRASPAKSAKAAQAKVDEIIERNQFVENFAHASGEDRIYNDYLRLPVDAPWTIICDVHAPFHSAEYLNKTILISEGFKSRRLLVAGDLFDMSFAKYWARMEGEPLTTLEDEAEAVKQVVRFLDYFDEIYLIRGNHENRVTRVTEAKIQAQSIVRLLTAEIFDRKFTYSCYDKAFVGDDWLVVHPKSYSQISASVATRMAEKFHRHVLNAHGHFQAMRWDRSGKFMGIDLGGLFDVEKIAYCSLSTTTHPSWNQGFAVLKNNHIYLFGEHTDWDLWADTVFK